ncbi:MAG: sigma-54-dependent Fis family transcriptional regulator, partial [Candidatus Desulfofervidaceae bacterium]|nr:sigma-54-dependent Fis family transcriptional regulator [Candidatus Desulfofervidaceae bacterium]
MSYRLLIIEDDSTMRFALSELLSQRGYEIVEAADAEAGLKVVQKEEIDLAIVDIKLPGMNGLEAISLIQEKDASLPVIIITAYGDKKKALEALKKGAYDYFTKPFKMEEIEIVIKRALEKRRLEKEIRTLRQQIEVGQEFREIIGQSEAMKKLFNLVKKVLDTDVTVLISGESGTGKELVASVLHHHSPRKDKPFIKINCAAIPETLLESELFGYEKGAFTGAISSKPGKFELAHEGTIFLDEIGEMPLSIQAKILRVLQEKEFERVGGTKTIKVDVRIIASTNRDLWEAVQRKTFREDLYFRLNVINIHLPPLRERKEDIPLLIEHFIRKY